MEMPNLPPRLRLLLAPVYLSLICKLEKGKNTRQLLQFLKPSELPVWKKLVIGAGWYWTERNHVLLYQ